MLSVLYTTSTYIPMAGIALMYYQVYVDTIALVAGLSTESTSSYVMHAAWLLSGYQQIPETGSCLHMSTTRGGFIYPSTTSISATYLSIDNLGNC
jgi:hypothetical protein